VVDDTAAIKGPIEDGFDVLPPTGIFAELLAGFFHLPIPVISCRVFGSWAGFPKELPPYLLVALTLIAKGLDPLLEFLLGEGNGEVVPGGHDTY
jgi:hypothetical protein